MKTHRTACAICAGLAVATCAVLAALLTARAGIQLSAITLPPATPDSTQRLLLAAAIQYYELPQGWRAGASEAKQELGANGRFYVFNSTQASDKPWLSMSEQVYLYPAEEEAKQRYPTWEGKYIPPTVDAWVHMPELDFQHRADQFRAACLSTSLNGVPGYACGAVARYRNLIVIVLANPFVAQWPTLADLRAVLEIADKRAASVATAAQSP